MTTPWWQFHPDKDPFMDEMGDCGYLGKWGWWYAGSVAASFSFFFSGVPLRMIRGLMTGNFHSKRVSKLGFRQLRTFVMMTSFFTLIITIFGTTTCVGTGSAIQTGQDMMERKQGRHVRY